MLSLPGPLTELGPIQKFSCWMYFMLSYTPLFLSTWCRGGRMGGSGVSLSQGRASGEGAEKQSNGEPRALSCLGQVVAVEGTGWPKMLAPLGGG